MDTDRTTVVLESDQLRLGPNDEGRTLSAAEFADAEYDPPYVYERVEGRLRLMSPEGKHHVSASEPWRDHLGAYALGRPDVVRRVASHARVRIDADTERIGDIGVYLAKTSDEPDIPDQVPDLMFEFVSPSKKDRRRDYVEKRADYLKVGVREYVIVDRFDRKVTVLTLGPGGYDERVIAHDGIYESPLLPEFSVRLSEVWPR